MARRHLIRALLGVWLVPVVASTPAQTASDQRIASGTITGRVTYAGEAPPAQFIPEGNVEQRALQVSPENQGLRHAVVAVDVGAGDISGSLDSTTSQVVLDQRRFLFTPPVLAIHERQTVRFTSQDSANHSVRSADRIPANRFAAFTGNGEDYVHRFRTTPSGRPIVVTCDIHAWMTAWIYVFGHPHFAVTDVDGRFTIVGLPEGQYRLEVRQPAGGLDQALEIDVLSGRVTDVIVAFDATDLAASPRP